MTSVERVGIPQKAVIWQYASLNAYSEPQVSAPEEIDVEWPQGFSETNAALDSKESASDELVVNESYPLGSILWFDEYVNLPTGTADDPSPLYVITGRRIQPDLKARAFRYTLTIARFSATLPDIV